MILGKDILINNRKREACRYQPVFDLRKHLAKVVANYSIPAVSKKIILDIFVAHETPNYFQGNLTCFLSLLSELFKHCIATLKEGEICVRINHDYPHKYNNNQAELSIIITAFDTAGLKNVSEGMDYTGSGSPVNKKIANLSSYNSLHRIQYLCGYLGGNFSTQRLDDRKIKYVVSLTLQQVHPGSVLHLTPYPVS